MMFGIAIGLLIGELLINLAVEDEKRVNNVLKATINNLEDDLKNANFKIKYRDDFVKQYQKEHEILLENASELRAKIVNLENNLELVTNSLPDNIKELISDFDG